MKTAIESYMETITLIEKEKVLAEQELQQLSQSNIENFLGPIQNGINLSIKKKEFNRTITIIEKILNTKYNGSISVWYLTSAQSNWEYNSTAKGYYTIPIFDTPILDVNCIINAIKDAGYTCSIKETVINEATSKTGKYAFGRNALEITIDWSNCLTLLGGESNG